MKIRSIIILLFLVTNLNSHSQITAQKSETRLAILESSYAFADCGIMAYAYGLKFRIVNTDFDFVCIIPCPEGYGKYFFQKGNKYQLEVKKVNNLDSAYHGYTIQNPYKKYNLPVYSVFSIKKRK